MAHSIPFSILDLAHIGQDKTVHHAVRKANKPGSLPRAAVLSGSGWLSITACVG